MRLEGLPPFLKKIFFYILIFLQCLISVLFLKRKKEKSMI